MSKMAAPGLSLRKGAIKGLRPWLSRPMLGVLLIAVGLNVVYRRNFAEYVGCHAPERLVIIIMVPLIWLRHPLNLTGL